ncbi:glutathione S-transferase N-terminal domain-containing protein [Frigidibacter sp. SD6-1]|uniref:glutathione S-transferase N-terminal domain-containing protein n=1 Tax=Frigidibacter sp. SD6-1 TaxID=3032581 RepID=UPI0024DFEA18|nr:glutathione S-transferase N-terminal domain-containing protein [Frigidibacter sp. SD6-1]
MILIGQYDSPFVRRVGVALTLYGLPFRQEPWSVFGDADRIRPLNPLTRVPTLVLDDGEALIDSHMILDHLDGLVAPEARLFPAAEPDRRRALKRAALATGIGDKAVSLFYERRLHERASDLWVARCRRQIDEGWQALEILLPDAATGHAEIAAACVWRFTSEAHPGLLDPAALPRLAALSERLEATEAFKAIYQPFIAPA